MEDIASLRVTVPLLTTSQYIEQIPLSSPVYVLKEDLSPVFSSPQCLTAILFHVFNKLLSVGNLARVHYLTIHSIINALKKTENDRTGSGAA